MDEKTITITEKEYMELLQAKEDLAIIGEFHGKIGENYKKYQYLTGLDKFCRKRYPAYKEFERVYMESIGMRGALNEI